MTVKTKLKGTPAKIYKFCVKQESLSENDSENKIKIRWMVQKLWTDEVPTWQPTGAAILCILPSMHLMSKSTCGSCLDVCDSQ